VSSVRAAVGVAILVTLAFSPAQAELRYNPAAHEDSEKQVLRFLKAHLSK